MAEVDEKFAPNGGQLSGAVGLVICATMVVIGVVDHDNVPLWVPSLGLLLAVVVWISMLRPRVWVEPGTLVLRNMLDTVRIPLAAVEEVAVRQVMAVRVGEKRYVCAGVGRSFRQAIKGSAVQRARSELGGLHAEPPPVIERGINYGDYIELKLRDLVAEDRTRRGIKAHSLEIEALAGDVRRLRAWPEIGALGVSGAFLILALLLG